MVTDEKNLELRKQELSEKYGIDFDKLEKEQINLSKELTIKDKIDFSLAERFGAVDIIFIKNKILCCFIVCDKSFEITGRSYILEKVKFPYFPGFRSYRELPSMIAAFEKLDEKPEVVFIDGQGIIHPRLGLASHFGLSTEVPTIGVSNSLIDCKAGSEDGADILKNGKKVGNVLIVKKGSNPLFISPGNNISIKASYNISKSLIRLPHKKPEPMHLASKYAKSVKKELML
ncbi:MAG: endonuclease V [Nanoarchaeota archaeon]